MMRRQLPIILVFIISWVLLSSCGNGPTYVARQGDVEVRMQFERALVVNQSVGATLTFTYNGAPLTVTQVVCDLQMPGMVMGSNRPMADRQSDDSHYVNILFTMDGDWAIVVTGQSDVGPIRVVFENILVAVE